MPLDGEVGDWTMAHLTLDVERWPQEMELECSGNIIQVLAELAAMTRPLSYVIKRPPAPQYCSSAAQATSFQVLLSYQLAVQSLIAQEAILS